MNALLALWLPILLSAVVVFVISSLVHMVFKWHAPDYRGFSNEEAVRAAIRAGHPTRGLHVVPYCGDMKEMGSEAMLQKYREGPIAYITIASSGVPNMGKSLGLWFLFCLVIAAAGALLATQLLGLDPAQARAAAKLVGAVSFIAHGSGTITESIWMARPWGSSAKHLLDAALYAIGSAFVFYWLWP
jgi:hypothetical protein